MEVYYDNRFLSVILVLSFFTVATADTELIEIVKDHHRPLGLHIRSKKYVMTLESVQNI